VKRSTLKGFTSNQSMSFNLLKRARTESHPLIDGDTVTFLWEGARAPQLVSDLRRWNENPQPLERITSGLWACSLDLPQDTYLEYSYYDPATGEHISDPLNRNRRCWNGINKYNNYFYMPGNCPTPLAKRRPGTPHGEVTRHEVEAPLIITEKKRAVYLYQPHTEEPVPLLVVLDGVDFMRRGKLVNIVENLIAENRIRPIALALVKNAGKAQIVENACADTTLVFLTGTIIPLAQRHLSLLDIQKTPGAFGIMGTSIGGLMALYTSLRLPQIFGKGICQAGAYQFWGQDGAVVPLARYLPQPDIKLWLDCGRMDPLLETNRMMAALLAEKGYNFSYKENGGAHNYATWKNACPEGLESLFGMEN